MIVQWQVTALLYIFCLQYVTTPQRHIQNQSVVHTPKGSQLIATPLDFGSPQQQQQQTWSAGTKRPGEFSEYDYPEGYVFPDMF